MGLKEKRRAKNLEKERMSNKRKLEIEKEREEEKGRYPAEWEGWEEERSEQALLGLGGCGRQKWSALHWWSETAFPRTGSSGSSFCRFSTIEQSNSKAHVALIILQRNCPKAFPCCLLSNFVLLKLVPEEQRALSDQLFHSQTATVLCKS